MDGQMDGCMDNIQCGQTSSFIIFCCGLIPHLTLLTHGQDDGCLNPGFKTQHPIEYLPLFCFQELYNTNAITIIINNTNTN